MLYACVSESQFRKLSRDYGIVPGIFMGKKIYRKEDLRQAMEKAWPQ